MGTRFHYQALKGYEATHTLRVTYSLDDTTPGSAPDYTSRQDRGREMGNATVG
ncbi:MAG: hypothetical protein KZQ77_06530 [Candidatus Thiodiazotropha sp. (ex Notomyrtea botanica)]|nr:hypothetical protein [Candidatus Thiodiazotropha sp. (ex Notomyrtea botanica)]